MPASQPQPVPSALRTLCHLFLLSLFHLLQRLFTTSLRLPSLPLSPVSPCSDHPLTSRRTSTTSCLTTPRSAQPPAPPTTIHPCIHPQQTPHTQQIHTQPLSPASTSRISTQSLSLCVISTAQTDNIAFPTPTLTASVLTANLVPVSCLPSFSTP